MAKAPPVVSAPAPLPKKRVQVRQIGIGVVLYDSEKEMAALLNLTAAVIWRYLGSGRTVSSIVDAFELGFAPGSVDRATVERDVLATLGYLENAGFVDKPETPLKARRPKEDEMAVVNDYGMPQIGVSYQRPEMKTYTLAQLQADFGPKSGSSSRGVRFSDTWTPEKG
jgi:hypothetical protein